MNLNKLLEVPCQIDDGTDFPVISDALCTRLGVQKHLMDTKLVCEMAIETTPTQVECTHEVFLDIELRVPEATNPIVKQHVRFVVLNGKMPVEVLFGRSFLRDIGIDVESQVREYAKTAQEEEATEENRPATKQDDTPATADTYDFQNSAEIEEEIEKMIQRALKAGLPRKFEKRFRSIVKKFDIWRTRLGADPPARVAPMKVCLKPGAPSIKASNRRYPPMYRKFIKKRFDELERFRLIYKNNRSRFSSPIHVLPKVDPPIDIDKDFRWTVDLRKINAWLDPLVWPMPNLDVIAEAVSNSQFFATLDMTRGYWQMPLHPDSQELFSMLTDWGVYSSTRVIQGSSDAVLYFQSTMEQCFASVLMILVIIWLDDILVHAKTIEEFLDGLEKVFSICDHFGLKLSPTKCTLFATKIRFCGKIFSKEGIAHDPERISSLVNMSPPTTAAELQQYLCALNWMRAHIPDFARLSKPLRSFMEEKTIGIPRKKASMKAIKLEWTNKALNHFEALNMAVAHVVTLAHPSPTAEFFLFTDASETGWGAVLFQIREYDSTKAIEEQSPQPLFFLSGCFHDAKLRWSVAEKEAFAIVESVDRLDFLLIRPKPFFILTDHRNLEFIFGSHTDLKKPTRHKITRWALALTSFNYRIKHIEGERNVWADLLSRWGQPSFVRTLSCKHLLLRPFAEDKNFAFPNLEEIWQSQIDSKLPTPTVSGVEVKLIENQRQIRVNGKPWLPSDADELLQRVLIVAHCGISGHRGVASTTRALQKYCYTEKLRTKVLEFLKSCLLCLQTKGGSIIPRPMGRTLQAQAPNEVLHFDFFFVAEAVDDWKYVLVLKDGLSHFVELIACTGTSSEVVVEALLGWFKRFGCVQTWVSDQPSHFKNTIIRQLAKRMKSNHHFTTAYCPWANGSVERVNRDLIPIFQALLAEFNLPVEHWPRALPIIQYVLNQSPTESLHGFAPIQIFMGREPSSPVKEIFDPESKTFRTIEWHKDELTKYWTQLKAEMALMHKKVRDMSDKIHERNSRRKAETPNFAIGDYVLWSRVDRKAVANDKMTMTWRGPFRIVNTISDQLYSIQHLTQETTSTVHGSRLKYYHDASLNVTAELKDHIDSQGFLYDIEKLEEIKWNKDLRQWEIRVQWQGFEGEDTFEPLPKLLTDVPELTCKFLATIPKRTLREVQRQHAKHWKKLKHSLKERYELAPAK